MSEEKLERTESFYVKRNGEKIYFPLICGVCQKECEVIRFSGECEQCYCLRKSAPELLEACERLLSMKSLEGAMPFYDDIEFAEKVIKKAKGESE